MTRKDYVVIARGFAEEMRRLRDEKENGLDRNYHMVGLILTAKSVATELAIDNPRFDRDRFLQACGAE